VVLVVVVGLVVVIGGLTNEFWWRIFGFGGGGMQISWMV